MEILLFKTFLLLTNFGILTYLLILVLHHYQSNYDKKSWAFLFHVLTFLWLIFRGFFWLSTLTTVMKWSTASFFILYWMPTPLEFGAFMLLPLYFAQILYPMEWKKYWIYVRPVYFGITIGIFLFQSGLSLFKPTTDKHCENVVDDYFAEECLRTENSTSAFREITAVCFLFLALIQCWFGIKVLKMDKNRYEQFLTTSPEMLSIVNIILVISFASRSFYQIMAVHHLMILPDVPLQSNDGDVQIAIFIAFELWIYIPTLLVLLTFTSRSMGNVQPPKEYYYFPSTNYGSSDLIEGDESDYENLLREVPSRQGSFWLKGAQHSELIPIKVGNTPDGGEFSVPSSFSRAQSWLSEPDPHRFVMKPTSFDGKSRSAEKEGISLLTHYKKFRQRGFSAGSDSSSVEGGIDHPVPHLSSNRKLKSSGASSSSHRRRKIRYYDEKKVAIVPSSDHKEGGEDEEEDDIITDTTHGVEIDKQYEFLVEPPSPSPRTCSSSFIQENEYLLQRKDSFRGIESIRISSYEATGGDHIHGTHLFATQHQQLQQFQQFPVHSLEENSPTALGYHHNRDEGSLNQSAKAMDNNSIAVHPIYPRPTRHNPTNHLFNNSKALERRLDVASSTSPSVMDRERFADNNSTPDRDEAAMEASIIRQGMTGSRFSPH